MQCDVERLVNALIGAEMLAQRKYAERTASQQAPAAVVTLSRGCGARGGQLARLLADKLGVCCYDREILDAVARRAAVDIDLVKSLDEHARRSRGDWWRSLVQGKGLSRDDYARHLVKVILGIARTGGVIVGRGANLILEPREAFRVRVVGSLSECAARVAEREGLGMQAARQRVQQCDAGRSRYIRRLYGADIEDSRRYDLVMNSDRLTPAGMVDSILVALRSVAWLPHADQRGPFGPTGR